MTYQPRYIAYATAHGRTPDEMLEHDRTAWPGGLMCGFILWSNRQLAKARKAHPDWFLNGTLRNHRDYDAWLALEVQNPDSFDRGPI